jgi:hypothetical protein
MATPIQPFEYTDLTLLDFCLWGLEVERSLRKIGDGLLARILDATACIKKREHQLRRTTRDLRTRSAKCTVVNGGIIDDLL